MRYIKDFNNYSLNEESLLKNIFLSAALSIGLNYADAQSVQKDSLKTEIINDISNYNKLAIMAHQPEINLENLKNNLSLKLEDTDIFIDKYLQILPNGTFVVKANFIEGLELHLRNNSFKVGYSIKL